MAFRLVNSAGNVRDSAFVNVYASGVVRPNEPVDWVPASTGGGIVIPTVGVDTTQTTFFGVALDYAQGASDTLVRVIPFDRSQLWEVDCANSATTGQIGILQYMSASRGIVHNQETNVQTINRVFLPLAMTGATTGSGKLLGIVMVDFGRHGT